MLLQMLATLAIVRSLPSLSSALVVDSSSKARIAVDEIVGRRRLGDRTQAFNASTLSCQMGGADPTYGVADIVYTDFYFYYAIGIKDTLDTQEMLYLEQVLYSAIKGDLLWCWRDETGAKASRQAPGNRVLLRSEKSRERVGRELGIIAFTPGGLDRATECKLS
jgi:hypothetical protein